MKYIVENTYSGACFLADTLEEALDKIRHILKQELANEDEINLYSAKMLNMTIDTTPRITIHE